MVRRFLALVVLVLPLAQLQCVGEDPGAVPPGTTGGDAGGPPPATEPPLCEDQRGLCAGAKKTNDLYVNGSWLPCTGATYAPVAGAACDDKDACTIDTVVGAPCDGVCGHSSTCPETLSLDAVADSTLDKAQPTVSSGGTATLQADSSSSKTKLAVIRFDPFANGRTFAKIDRAVLRIPVRSSDSGAFPGDVSAQALLVKTEWSESVVTWSSALQMDTGDPLSALDSSTTKMIAFDVTEWVRNWNTNPASNMGVAIAAYSDLGSAALTFASREEPTGGPKLDLIVNAHTVSLPAVEDTHLSQVQPTANFGNDKQLTFSSEHDGTLTRVLVRYDLTPIPVGATVLYAEAAFHIVSGQLLPWLTYAATQKWTETGATWKTTPTYEGTLIGRLEPGAAGRASVDVTSLLGRWMMNDIPNNGLVFINESEEMGGFSRTAMTASHESDTVTIRPTIDVLYK